MDHKEIFNIKDVYFQSSIINFIRSRQNINKKLSYT